MYIALSIITVMLIVLFAFFVLKACEENSKKSGYIIIPVNKDMTEKKLAKAVKRAYFEESFNGLDNMRTIIITGIDIDDKTLVATTQIAKNLPSNFQENKGLKKRKRLKKR